MIHPCRGRLAELQCIVYKERCKLCLGLPSQTGGCRFASAVITVAHGGNAGRATGAVTATDKLSP